MKKFSLYKNMKILFLIFCMMLVSQIAQAEIVTQSKTYDGNGQKICSKYSGFGYYNSDMFRVSGDFDVSFTINSKSVGGSGNETAVLCICGADDYSYIDEDDVYLFVPADVSKYDAKDYDIDMEEGFYDLLVGHNWEDEDEFLEIMSGDSTIQMRLTRIGTEFVLDGYIQEEDGTKWEISGQFSGDLPNDLNLCLTGQYSEAYLKSFTNHKASVKTITLSQSYANLTPDNPSLSLQASVSPSGTENTDLVWETSDSSIVIVDNNGQVKGVGNGQAVIKVRTADNSCSATCNITCTGFTVPITSINIDPQEFSLEVDKSRTLTASVYPSTADKSSLKWTSFDTTIAVVTQDGKVTGKGEGKTVIEVMSPQDSTIYARASVTVTDPAKVTKITLNKTTATIKSASEKVSLSATITPSNAKNKEVIWTSSDNSLATVSQDGVVTGLKDGKVTITATSKSNDKVSAKCTITITGLDKIMVTRITLNNSSISLNANTLSMTLTAKITPNDATDRSIYWISSNTSVAIVNEKGVVTAIADGTAKITAYSPDGVEAECSVTVSGVTKTKVTGVSLDTTKIRLYEDSASAQLTASVYPTNATNKNVTWSSSDTDVVTVDSNGNLRAVDDGTATITVKTVDGSYTDKCSVTVDGFDDEDEEREQQTITGNNTVDKQYGSGVFYLNAKCSSGNKLSYVSSNTKVVKVDYQGKVKIVGIGEARITVTADADAEYEGAEKEILVIIRPRKQRIVSIKVKRKKITIQWQKQAKVTGYRLQWSKNASFKKAKEARIDGRKKTKQTIKVKKGKWYVRVCSYGLSNGTPYTGKWSKVKIKTVK